jgi:hypothetical protein
MGVGPSITQSSNWDLDDGALAARAARHGRRTVVLKVLKVGGSSVFLKCVFKKFASVVTLNTLKTWL